MGFFGLKHMQETYLQNYNRRSFLYRVCHLEKLVQCRYGGPESYFVDVNWYILAFQDPRRDPRTALSRSALLSDLTAKGLLNLVPEPIKQLYAVLESDFSPLHLCAKLAPMLEQLDSLNQPLSSASPVQDVQLGHYKTYLQQVNGPIFPTLWYRLLLECWTILSKCHWWSLQVFWYFREYTGYLTLQKIPCGNTFRLKPRPRLLAAMIMYLFCFLYISSYFYSYSYSGLLSWHLDLDIRIVTNYS